MLVRFAIVAALLSSSACVGGPSSTGIDPITCPPTGTMLTYQNFGAAMINSKCTGPTGCHSTRRPVLTSQSAVEANAGNIMDQAVYTDAMPKVGSMTLDERKQLGEWLACGAP